MNYQVSNKTAKELGLLKGCFICIHQPTCQLYKQKLEANGLGEDVEFKCGDFEEISKEMGE